MQERLGPFSTYECSLALPLRPRRKAVGDRVTRNIIDPDWVFRRRLYVLLGVARNDHREDEAQEIMWLPETPALPTPTSKSTTRSIMVASSMQWQRSWISSHCGTWRPRVEEAISTPIRRCRGWLPSFAGKLEPPGIANLRLLTICVA